MGVEIERKFLVNRAIWGQAFKGEGQPYRQGYISTDPNKTIRVRLAGRKAYLTIKGISRGASRPEFEYAIPEADAKQLLDQFCMTAISKIRFRVEHEGRLWEVDEFSGDNLGLVMAELELQDENEPVQLPTWIDREVTGDSRYFNSNLSIHPYTSWKEPPQI